ncbi:MAG: molybdate ABC transporter substrate-binding protein [Deltaproteobacteria bacterium]|nr:molybdate ABC transporter substrate-binding protein [Deltaproteobacteria bacterium]
MDYRFFRSLKIWGLIRFALSVFVIFLGTLGTAGAEDLFMYCGAGLRQPIDELLEAYKQQTGINVAVEFGGAGQMLTRYKATGKGDLFLPGSHFYVEQLKKNNQVIFSKQVVLHTPVFAVNKKMGNQIKTFDDLAVPGVRVGLGDPKAMALGRTAEDILINSGIKDAILKNTIVRAATVKQLTLYVVKGDVDAAIIARADAFQNKESLTYFDIDPTWYTPEIVTVAALKTASDPAAARKLAEYLGSFYAVEIFGRYGFLPAP